MEQDKQPQPPQPLEGEIVPPDTQIARSQAATIEELSQNEEGVAKLDRGLEMMKTLRAASIAFTFPHDWVLFKADDRITGYLQDSGCQRIKDLWGIEVYDLGEWIKTEDLETKEFSWTITGSGISKRTGQVIVGISGTRYSYEDFIVHRHLKRLQIDTEVKKAARANLDGSIVRELAGVKSVPAEELDQVWATAGMGYKTTKLCPKGRGFGSQAERQGAQVQQNEDIRPGEEPYCQECDNAGKPGMKMKFVPAGKSRTSGKPYDAFWSCPVNGSSHRGMPHADHMKRILAQRAAAEGPDQ